MRLEPSRLVEGDLDGMAAYPRLTDGEPLAGPGEPDGLQVQKCIGRMYLMTSRPDRAANQRAELLRSSFGLRQVRRSVQRDEGASWLRRRRAGILEVVDDDAGGTYRAVYTVTCKEAVFVLHGLPCSQKKRERATATPKENTGIIRVRLTVPQPHFPSIILWLLAFLRRSDS